MIAATRRRNGALYREETDALLALLDADADADADADGGRSGLETPAGAATAGMTNVATTALTLPTAARPVQVRVYREMPPFISPVLLWLHGGGFVGGTLDDVDNTCVRLAQVTSCVVVSLDYRLAPAHPYPAALNDTVSTMNWLGANARVLGGDGRLVVGGQSAGATLVLAALMSLRHGRGPAVTAQVLCYPWLDDRHSSPSWQEFDGVLHDRQGLERALDDYLSGVQADELAMPLRATSFASLPRALVLAAGRDPLRDDARSFTEQLASDGGIVELIEYVDTMHAFLNFPGQLSAARDAIADIGRYLTDVFGMA